MANNKERNINSIQIIYMTLLAAIPATVSERKCAYIGYRGRNTLKNATNCPATVHCTKNYTIAYIDFPPYSTSKIFEEILQTCCQGCGTITRVHKYTNISEVQLSRESSPHFILPFLGRASAAELYSYHFIPFANVPHGYYITKNHPSPISQAIAACLNLYRLIVVCLLAAVISGFVIWALETKYKNEENFPPSFCEGVFEGFWWSFVSMTTVGYGDTLVRSAPAKIFSVVWILIGIIMFCFLTSLVTTELMFIMEPHRDSMAGRRVGVLKYRDYDATLVVSEGGVVVETEGWNFYSDVLMLMRKLRHKEIDGFLLDKYTLMYTQEYVKWKVGKRDVFLARNGSSGEEYAERKDDIEFFLHSTHTTVQSRIEKHLSYGVLVREYSDYHYLNNAVRDNRFSLEVTVGSDMNEQFPQEEKTAFLQVYFFQAMKIEGWIIACIVCFGIFYEFCYRGKRLSVKLPTKCPRAESLKKLECAELAKPEYC